MDADIAGALEQLDKSWRAFEHRGEKMTKNQVRNVLLFGIRKGYKSISELKDKDVDMVLLTLKIT